MRESPITKFRHDLGQGTVRFIARMADEDGAIAALCFDDEERRTRIGLRLRTEEQCRNVMEGAIAAMNILREEAALMAEIDREDNEFADSMGKMGRSGTIRDRRADVGDPSIGRRSDDKDIVAEAFAVLRGNRS